MKQKVLYVALGVLALAVAVPLATRSLAQSPTPTPAPATTTAPQLPTTGPWSQGMGPGMMGNGHMGGAGGGVLADWQTLTRVATLLKLTPQDIYTQVQSGQTLAAIAQAQGVSVNDVAGTVLAPFKDELQIRVKYGNITQEQADFTVFVRTQNLIKQLEQPIGTNLPGGTGMGGMMGTQGTGIGGIGGGMMAPQGNGGGGMMGGGMMGGGMMGGSGQTW